MLSLFAFSCIDNEVNFAIFQAVHDIRTAFSDFIYTFTLNTRSFNELISTASRKYFEAKAYQLLSNTNSRASGSLRGAGLGLRVFMRRLPGGSGD